MPFVREKRTWIFLGDYTFRDIRQFHLELVNKTVETKRKPCPDDNGLNSIVV